MAGVIYRVAEVEFDNLSVPIQKDEDAGRSHTVADMLHDSIRADVYAPSTRRPSLRWRQTA